MNISKDDRILPLSRIVAAIVVPFLVLAFIILYFFPETTAERFAWEIRPDMTAAFMGAGYLGGSWLFINVIFGHHWHRVAPGFPPVTAFTIAMLLATILHWDRFVLTHVPFLIWLVLYVVTPFLVPYIWWRNRFTDPGPHPSDKMVPMIARLGLGLLGAVLLAFALLAFVAPEQVINLWPWTLTPLTARIMGGWFALLGVGGLVIARDPRWSAWTVGLGAIGLWHALVLIAAVINAGDFPDGIVNWYTVAVAAVLIGMGVLIIFMRRS